VRAEIARAGIQGTAEIGRVMGPLMGKLRGKADGSVVQRITREELGA
jgi:hypothetical protein